MTTPLPSGTSTLNDLLKTRVASTPNSTAYRTFTLGLWETTSWDELAAHVGRTASGLVSLGVSDGSVVCIAADNSPAWVVSALAVTQLGATILAVPPETSFEAMGQTLLGAQVKVCIAGDEEQLDKIVDSSPDVVVVVIDTRGVRSLDQVGRQDAATRLTYAQLQSRSSASTVGLVTTADHPAWRTKP